MGLELIAVALAVSTAPPQHAASERRPDIIVQGARPDPDQILCERVVEAGSRVNVKRRCATRREWDASRQADREALDDSFRRSLQSTERGH